MALRLAAAGLVGIALLVTGCGENRQAKAVSRYIDEVNAVQSDLRVPLAHVATGYRELQRGAKVDAQQRRLKQSAQTLRKLERRLDALEPPADARRLDSLMRQTVHAEWELGHELVLAAAYARASKRPLARAATAQTRVRAGLKVAKKPTDQAVALEEFAGELDRVAKQLRGLHPAPTLVPQHRTTVRMYERIAASARKLARALRAGKDATKPLYELQVAAASGSTLVAQRARIAAVRAYNRRVVRVRRLYADTQTERTRLQRTL